MVNLRQKDSELADGLLLKVKIKRFPVNLYDYFLSNPPLVTGYEV